MIKKIGSHIWVWAVMVLTICCSTQQVYASDTNKQIVRVAYFDMGNYYEEISDGSVQSYDTEALNKIANYSNLQFEYVNCGTWANALAMLKRHEVDLVGTMQWTDEREQEYEFCLQNYGYTVGELAGLTNRNYIYEDYETIGKSVIGTTKNYVRMSEMNEMFQKHNISPTIKTYEGQGDLEKALEAGEIDLIAANSHTLRKEWTVVEKFSYAPFYLVSWKGNEQLTNQIDDAIIAINLSEPTSDDELLQKYFPSIIGAPLTKEELSLIAEGKTYDVYMNSNTKPVSWYDEETGTMKGVLVEVCKQISESTGLKLNTVPIFDGQEQLDDSKIRTTTFYNGVIEDMPNNIGVTNALIIDAFNFYYRNNGEITSLNDSCTVAVMPDRKNLQAYIKEQYANAVFQEYDSPAECLRAVEKGEVEFAYLDCRIAENAILENGIQNIREFPIESSHQGITLVFPGADKELLSSIVNKGLEQVDQNEISNLFVQYALTSREPVNWNTMFTNHIEWIIFGSVCLCLILICFTVLFTYARVMKNQKDKIAKADADKTEFFSRMSHDMRTPMNGILGMIRLSKDSNDIAEMHENMNKAESAGEYMLSLINDTLDLQRLESKKLQLEKEVVNVIDYYSSIFSIMQISAQQKQLEFNVRYIDIDMSDYIVLDTVRVKQILSNLISNAIKFTPAGGAVEVIVESLGQDASVLHRKYTVKDTGIGMSEEFIQNRLFKPYSQENNELSSQLTGSGLGMAITKNLVEIMGGHLEVDSALGEGTTFTAYLDIQRATKESADKLEREKKEKSETIMADLSGRKILLCEDHPLNAEIAQKLLEKAGCSVEWAENGQIGVELFEKSEDYSFDAVLMDIRMPVMDGISAARTIRSLLKPDAATVPIIAMTANAYDSDIQNCMDAGMNAHIAKPVNPQRLYKVLYDCTSKNV